MKVIYDGTQRVQRRYIFVKKEFNADQTDEMFRNQTRVNRLVDAYKSLQKNLLEINANKDTKTKRKLKR